MSEDGSSQLRLAEAASAPEDWDAYVERHPAATAYHRAAAVAIGASTFRLRTFYLTARDSAGALRGILPLVEQSSLLFGRFLSSVPFFTYGGVLADDVAAARALRARAETLGAARRARHVELREREADPHCDLPLRDDKVSMVLDLGSSEEALLKRLGSKLRSQIKRAERENPEVVVGGAELLDDFYAVFAQNMHELGTPVYPRRFFANALAAFGPSARVFIIRTGAQPQAAAITVRHGDSIEVPWASCTPAGKRGSLNMRMYQEMLLDSLRAGAKHFDFGRCSVGAGTYRFKEQWGAKPLPLYWYYWMPSGRVPPQLNHSNPKYALAAAAWRKLPLALANLAGPWIVRSLP
jgi:serine/alanine adding enzyme